MRTQIKVDGTWIDGEPQLGEWYKQQVGTFPNGDPVWQQQRNVPLTTPVDPIKKVGMGELGELLPAAVLIELEDYKRLSATTQPKREAAARVLTRINSNYPVDVLHSDFVVLMGQLVTHTSLTAIQRDAILTEMQG